MTELVDRIAQAIRIADGNHTLGAGALAEAVLPVVEAEMAERWAEIKALAEQVAHTRTRAEAAEAKVARVEEALAVLDEVAYDQIALEKMLTIQPTGANRAQVPPHWQDEANFRARPYRENIRAALDGGR